MHLNLSEGFGRASQSLQQGVNVHAQEQLEQMRDQRAENLARMQFGWKAQHDINILERQSTIESKRAEDQMRLQSMLEEGRDKRWDDRSSAAETRANIREDAATARAKQAEIARTRFDLSKIVEEYDSKIHQANVDYMKELAQTPARSLTGQALEDYLHNHPALLELRNNALFLENQKRQQVTTHMAYLADLGDSALQGFKAPPTVQQPQMDGGQPSTGGAGPRQFAPSLIPGGAQPLQPVPSAAPVGAGDTRPTDNPNETDPRYRADIPAFQSYNPSATAGGSGPTFQPPPTQPPVATLVGPLKQSPSLIPTAGGGQPGSMPPPMLIGQ